MSLALQTAGGFDIARSARRPTLAIYVRGVFCCPAYPALSPVVPRCGTRGRTGLTSDRAYGALFLFCRFAPDCVSAYLSGDCKRAPVSTDSARKSASSLFSNHKAAPLQYSRENALWPHRHNLHFRGPSLRAHREAAHAALGMTEGRIGIAESADIARHRRDRKGKTEHLPRRHRDAEKGGDRGIW